MGAPIVVNTVKVQGTVTAGGTTAIFGTVNVNNAVAIGSYDSTGTAKIMPIGGTNELTQWVPLGINAGRLLTDAVVSSGTVALNEAISAGLSASGTESIIPSGFVDSSTGNWTYLTLNSGSVPATVSGTVEVSAGTVSSADSVPVNSNGFSFAGNVLPIGFLDNSTNNWVTVKARNDRLLVAPAAEPAYIAGTVTIPNSSPAYVAGTVTMPSNSAGFVQGSVTALTGTSATSLGKAEDAAFATGDVGIMALAVRQDSGTASFTTANLDYSPISVDYNGRTNVIERGSAIAHGSAAVSTSAQILAASGTRRTAVITNLGTDYVWLGASGVATGSGLRLAPGQTAVIDRAPQAAIHGVAQSGTQSVSFFTESD